MCWDILWQDKTQAGSAVSKYIWCNFAPSQRASDERDACILVRGPSEQKYFSVQDWEFGIVLKPANQNGL